MYQAIYIKSENKRILESRNLKKLEKVSCKFKKGIKYTDRSWQDDSTGLLHRPDNLSLIPWTHVKIEGDNQHHRVALKPPHMHNGKHTHNTERLLHTQKSKSQPCNKNQTKVTKTTNY